MLHDDNNGYIHVHTSIHIAYIKDRRLVSNAVLSPSNALYIPTKQLKPVESWVVLPIRALTEEPLFYIEAMNVGTKRLLFARRRPQTVASERVFS